MCLQVRWRTGLCASVLFSVSCGERISADQPMAFSHASHMKEELTCSGCHKGVAQSDAAGFPRLKGCMLCHKKPTGTHPDEPKVREFSAQKREIPWVRVNGNPGHVFFSHRAHVIAKIDCEQCHGRVAELTEAVTTRTPALHDMDVCMACHALRGASNDCLECHQ